MNEAILRFIYRLEFIAKVIFTRSPVIIYCRHQDLKPGDTIYFGSDLKATFRRIKK